MHLGHLAWWECNGVRDDTMLILHLKKHCLMGGRFSGNQLAYCSWTFFLIEKFDVGMESAMVLHNGGGILFWDWVFAPGVDGNLGTLLKNALSCPKLKSFNHDGNRSLKTLLWVKYATPVAWVYPNGESESDLSDREWEPTTWLGYIQLPLPTPLDTRIMSSRCSCSMDTTHHHLGADSAMTRIWHMRVTNPTHSLSFIDSTDPVRPPRYPSPVPGICNKRSPLLLGERSASGMCIRPIILLTAAGVYTFHDAHTNGRKTTRTNGNDPSQSTPNLDMQQYFRSGNACNDAYCTRAGRDATMPLPALVQSPLI